MESNLTFGAVKIVKRSGREEKEGDAKVQSRYRRMTNKVKYGGPSTADLTEKPSDLAEDKTRFHMTARPSARRPRAHTGRLDLEMKKEN